MWRRNDKIETFELNTLTFGVSSSPFLAIRAIQRLADDERHIYPRAAEILTTHLYVDDLLSGADTIEEARTIREELITLLARGGFTIRQWASNDERVINDLASNVINTYKFYAKRRSIDLKTLGITWGTQDDKICYSAHPIKITDRLTRCDPRFGAQ